MDADEFKALKKKCEANRVKRSTRPATSEDSVAIPAAALEPRARAEPVGSSEAAPQYSQVSLVVTSYRARRHDVDGISAKAAIDGLVRARILKDDSIDDIKEITFISHLCKKGQEEHTIIDIYDAS